MNLSLSHPVIGQTCRCSFVIHMDRLGPGGKVCSSGSTNKEKFEYKQKRAAELTQKFPGSRTTGQADRIPRVLWYGATSWKETAEVESAAVTSLPVGVCLVLGKIEITFSAHCPCELLHALSKVMEYNWPQFCAVI